MSDVPAVHVALAPAGSGLAGGYGFLLLDQGPVRAPYPEFLVKP